MDKIRHCFRRDPHTFLYRWMGKYAFLAPRALASTETQNLDFLHTKAEFSFKKFNRSVQLRRSLSLTKSEAYSSNASETFLSESYPVMSSILSKIANLQRKCIAASKTVGIDCSTAISPLLTNHIPQLDLNKTGREIYYTP